MLIIIQQNRFSILFKIYFTIAYETFGNLLTGHSFSLYFPHPESNDSFKNLQILGFLVNGNFIQNH